MRGSPSGELATGVFVSVRQRHPASGRCHHHRCSPTGLSLAGWTLIPAFPGLPARITRVYAPFDRGGPHRGVVRRHLSTPSCKLNGCAHSGTAGADGNRGLPAPDRYDITFDHVSFAYREGAGVLEDVSFTARQGEVTALMGPSGGGKSTALQAGRPVLGRHRREGARGRDGRVHGGPGDPPALLLHGVPGCGAVSGHGDGEHPSGPPGRHRRGGAGGRAGPPNATSLSANCPRATRR